MDFQQPETATELYRTGLISLAKAANLSNLSMSEFIHHLGDLGIEVVHHDETVQQETQDVSQWLSL